ncbi:thioester reductase domain-containing protein [Paenibacillus dendritiformis]|uniref:thioester reductase domain-containing protein n=1 Tax=Paenibacillus dendritiformis TaxID=130049 RepID=UPI00364C2380
MTNKISDIPLIDDRGRPEQEMQYWMNKLEGELQMSGFDFNLECPSGEASRQQHYESRLEAGEALQLLTQCKHNPYAVFIALLATLQLLISRYSGADDVLIGIPQLKGNPDQPQPAKSEAPGLLPIRSHTDWSMSFRQYAGMIQQTVLEAYRHQHIPFANFLPERSDAGSNIFRTAVLLTDIHGSPAIENVPADILFGFRLDHDTLVLAVSFDAGVHSLDMIQQYAGHFRNLLTWLTTHPDEEMCKAEMLTSSEQLRYLHEFGHVANKADPDATVVEWFEARVKQFPDHPAVIDGECSYTYAELNARSNQLAHFLLLQGVNAEEAVGVLLHSSVAQAVAVMGVLKAGAAFVPIDADIPEERIRSIVNDAGIKLIISSKLFIRTLNRLQWECPALARYLCLDSNRVHEEEEGESNSLMNEELWEYTGSAAGDEIAGGGWVNSYTGEHFSKQEMDEYGDNVLAKLRPYLNKRQKVLEIGCASGITMYRIAPMVKEYYGTDLSGVIIAKNQMRNEQEGIQNITLRKLAAHEIGSVPGTFDLIILNSVVQCFHGHNYFRSVLRQAIAKLDTEGLIFIGDVMDQERKEEFIDSLREFAAQHPDKRSAPKLDWDEELFLSQSFFLDLQQDMKEIRHIEFSNKLGSIRNELTEYRYDVLLRINKAVPPIESSEGKRHKYQLGVRELEAVTDTSDLPQRAGIDNIAYVIYTSGTTGRPKGVMIEHRGLANLCAWHNDCFEVTPDDRATRYAGFGFDASVWELFPYLVQGATVYFVEPEMKLDVHKLNEFYENNRITISFLPTQMCEQFLEAGNRSLRYLLTGGDKLRHWKPASCQVVNNYGPTENTVVTTSGVLNENSTIIPIGKPISNVGVMILDTYGRLQPVGAPGEICISGTGLSRGYVDQQGLMEEKYIDHPFVPGEKMYKSGDLGRWMPDGSIEFLGRFDCQVKIRGYRIELAEVENQLLNLTNMKEAVVIDRQDDEGTPYLCAYYVTKSPGMEPADVKRALAKELPDYMIPPYFVEMPSIPLMPSGKVNRKLLPEPDERLCLKKKGYKTPNNEMQRVLCGIWQEVLGAAKIGIRDNFFDIGGNSLKAVRAVSKMSQQFEVDINQLFQNPTIEQLSRHIHFKKLSLEEKIERAKQLIGLPRKELSEISEFAGKLEFYKDKGRHLLTPIQLSDDSFFPANIFLTGATGYLGIHLLFDLLESSHAHIYVLKRAADQPEAETLLMRKAAYSFGVDAYGRFRHRIHVICGDIAKERFGLDPIEYRQLAERIDTVIHAAANVKHYGAYDDFYQANVLGTEHVIRFALQTRGKSLHYISTVGVASGTINNAEKFLFTEDDHDVGQQSGNFYTKTKIEAEMKVWKSRQDGLAATIYRVGNLVCHSETGKFQENISDNGFYRMLRSFIGLERMPEQSLHAIDFSFVDYVSKAIVLLMKRQGKQSETYHVYNHKHVSLRQLSQWLNEAGYAIEAMPPAGFLDYLYAYRNEQAAEEHVENILLHSRILDMDATFYYMTSDRTVKVLAELGFEWPEVNAGHIQKMMDYCAEVSFV